MDLLFGRPDYSYVPRTFSPSPGPEMPMRKKATGSKLKGKKTDRKAR
jgi:hypothetical protein